MAGPLFLGLWALQALTRDGFDPGAGFPVGAPEGRGEVSWHGVLHEAGFGIAQVGWTAGAIVFARRFRGRARWGTVAAIVGALVIAGWPDAGSLSVRLLVATAVQVGFVAVVCRIAYLQTRMYVSGYAEYTS